MITRILFLVCSLSHHASFAAGHQDKAKKPINKIPAPETTPYPSPSPQLKRGEYIIRKGSPQLKDVIITAPHEKTTTPQQETSFELKETGGQYFLNFTSKNPNLYLETKIPFYVQFSTYQPLKITPYFISRSDWPKNSSSPSLKITIEEEKVSKPIAIAVEAHYTYCNKMDKTCKKAKSKTYFHYGTEKAPVKK